MKSDPSTIKRPQLERAVETDGESLVRGLENLVRDIVSAYWDLLFASRDLENKHRSVALARRWRSAISPCVDVAASSACSSC